MNEVPTPQETPSPRAAPNSAMARIRQLRDKIANAKVLTLLVPAYEDLLAIRYNAIPIEELNSFLDRAAKTGNKKKLLEANADLLIRCCSEIICRQSVDAEWEAIDLDAGDPTAFSSPQCGSLFGVQAKSAREAVFAVFSPDGSQPMAVGVHSDALADWMRGKSEEIAEELLGE